MHTYFTVKIYTVENKYPIKNFNGIFIIFENINIFLISLSSLEFDMERGWMLEP